MVHQSIPRSKATQDIFCCLITLIVADIILTCIAVGARGAHELNPLYWMTDGIHQFIAVKVIVSLLGVAALFYLEMQYPRRIRVCLSFLCGLYAGTLIWNVCGLLAFAFD